MIRKILQIDDDPDDCEMIRDALQSLDGTISYTAINNPLEALQRLQQKAEQPDMIILDQNMHCMSGLELLALLKKDPFLNEIRVVMLSTSCSPKMMRQAIELGATECVMKPNNFSGLKKLLNRILL